VLEPRHDGEATPGLTARRLLASDQNAMLGASSGPKPVARKVHVQSSAIGAKLAP
jgi:hypothetical protein